MTVEFASTYFRQRPDQEPERLAFIGWRFVPSGMSRHGEWTHVGFQVKVRNEAGVTEILDESAFEALAVGDRVSVPDPD